MRKSCGCVSHEFGFGKEFISALCDDHKALLPGGCPGCPRCSDETALFIRAMRAALTGAAGANSAAEARKNLEISLKEHGGLFTAQGAE